MKLKLRMTPHRKCTRGGALGLPASRCQAEGRRFLPGARPSLFPDDSVSYGICWFAWKCLVHEAEKKSSEFCGNSHEVVATRSPLEDPRVLTPLGAPAED